jgi:hypothetical protein
VSWTVVEIVGERTLTVEAPDEAPVTLAVGASSVVLELAETGIQGPAGPTGPTGAAGPQGPTGPAGPSGIATESVYSFASPLMVWDATHSFTVGHPDVLTLDTSDDPIFGDVEYPTPTTVRITWAWPVAGTLVLTP